MTDESSEHGYRRPPNRACDPQRMNWLWRLIGELAELSPGEVDEALRAVDVAADARRIRGWSASEAEDDFFPITLAEMERNLRALVALRRARRDTAAVLDAAAHPHPDAPPPA
ncbi:hypothetical protein [Frateuria defendens]|uniref:hypothetical protein n=1 Tax=Frateuria defendens TaxID=2219559 RepID=UPI00066FDCEE|nr:hypothetical protein [Frateuria defendens]